MSSSLVVTGTIGIDSIHTPTHSVEAVLGGSASYFAAAASYLTRVRLVAAVGNDWPQEHEDTLKRFDIDVQGIERRSDADTFSWTGRYHDNMNQRDTLEVDVSILEQPPSVPDAYSDSNLVFLANNEPSLQRDFLRSFPRRNFVVADTMDLWINTRRDELNALLKEIDGLVLNDSESELMTEINNPIGAARVICDTFDLRFVIVKKGAHGSILVHRDGVAVLPAYPVENVVDPTGAGDTFAGGLMGYLAGANRTDFVAIQNAMSVGTVVSSFTVESFTLERLADLTLGDIHGRMIEFARMVRVV